MFETFRSIRTNMLLAALGCLALGAALLIFPDAVLHVSCYVIGALLIAYGVLGVLGCVRDHMVRVGTILVSVIAVAAGILVINQPVAISSLLPIVVGLILLLDGAFNVRHGIGLRRFGDPFGTSVLVLGVITVAFGAIILLNPYSTATITFRLIGIGLVYSGVSDLIILFRMNRASKTYEQQKIIDVEAHPVEDDGKEG